MWTYLIGPILAILPAPWRDAMSWADDVQWSKAAAVSGLIEFIGSLVGLMLWYSHVVPEWVSKGVSSSMDGKMGGGVAPEQIGTLAIFIWATSPLTWLLVYSALEGVVRFCAALVAGTAHGILPLFLIDKVAIAPFRPRNEKAADAPTSARELVTSYAGAIRDKVTTVAHAEVRDEIRSLKNESGEILEIYTCKKKADWTPPRMVRYLDGFYRLEEGSNASGPRPFRYVLRKLPVGVPGRTVLDYAPFDPVIRNAG